MTTAFERYLEAYRETKREPGEDICAWLDRLCAAAIPEGNRQLPRGDRDPGQDG